MSTKVKGTPDKIVRAKYNAIKKRLHICSPNEKEGLKQLFDYYYHVMVKRNML